MNIHPYKNLESHPYWEVISKALIELEKNNDFIFQTKKEYVCGYILKSLLENKINNKNRIL